MLTPPAGLQGVTAHHSAAFPAATLPHHPADHQTLMLLLPLLLLLLLFGHLKSQTTAVAAVAAHVTAVQSPTNQHG
jgi:hypothetical protein